MKKIQIGVLLGYLGDPRVGNPSTDSYWVRVEVSFLDLLVGKFPVTTQEWRKNFTSLKTIIMMTCGQRKVCFGEC